MCVTMTTRLLGDNRPAVKFASSLLLGSFVCVKHSRVYFMSIVCCDVLPQ